MDEGRSRREGTMGRRVGKGGKGQANWDEGRGGEVELKRKGLVEGQREGWGGVEMGERSLGVGPVAGGR